MNDAELWTLLGGLGGNGILLLGIWGLLTGKIVTRGHYDDMRGILQQRIDIQSEVIRRLRGDNLPD